MLFFKNYKNQISPVVELITGISIILSGCLFAYNFYQNHTTELKATLLSSQPDKVSLLIGNTGGKDIAITKITINVPSVDISNDVNLKGLGTHLKSRESLVIESLKSKLNDSVIYSPVHDTAGVTIGKVGCEIVIKYVNLDSDGHQLKIPSTCIAATFLQP